MTGIPGRIGAALRYLVPLAVTLVAAIAAMAVIPDHKRLVRWLYVILLVSALALLVSVVMIGVQSYLDWQRDRRTRDETVATALRSQSSASSRHGRSSLASIRWIRES
jgi:hypothetical protein